METKINIHGALPLKENKYTLLYLFFISNILKCIYFQFTTGLNNLPLVSRSNFNMLLGTLSSLFFIFFLIILIPKININKKIIVFSFLISVLLLVDTNFFRYYRKLISIPVFSSFDFNLVTSVNNSILGLFKFTDIIYLIDLPFLFYISKEFNKTHLYRKRIKYSFQYSFIFLCISFFLFQTSYHISNIQKHTDNSRYVTRKMGLLYAHYYDIKYYFEDKTNNTIVSKSDLSLLNNYYETKNYNSQNKYYGIAKKKNLIVVQVEALQEFIIGKTINGKEITPNINKLLKESIYFNNLYYQIEDGSTSDAEFLCNTSLYPLKEGSVYYRYAENNYPSLAKLVNENGYNSYVCHGFSSIFWNRRQMYETLEFDKFIDSSYYNMDDLMGWDNTALSDISFFKQTFDKFDTSKPFYSFLITLTTHYPFEGFEEYGFNVGAYEGTFIGDYIKAAHYADQSIGVLINELKNRDLYETSVLAIYGDHFAVPLNKKTDLLNYLNLEYSDTEWIKLQKVPLILHYSGLNEGSVNNTTGGQIDIMPTMINLLGLDSKYSLGKDLLNCTYGYAVLRNGSIVTDDYYYFSDKKIVYNIESEKELNISNYKNIIDKYQQELKISDIIISKNLLDRLN
ncbi:LTA synthase family protein [Clostridium grantii]|uniref:Phosphoglycerol transferase MdoB n=1 Tax=Clostridium grantii DSM 8605 TaxID=1121316 RepID=A0A1M5QHA1_9CLOT|nr:LTA synthase family protein [Clostridium grantii]SHH13477.1 Phosphoglycerol transferase MdoB [Clostridium grantii DSM 8605]